MNLTHPQQIEALKHELIGKAMCNPELKFASIEQIAWGIRYAVDEIFIRFPSQDKTETKHIRIEA
jgi:hypothetical protein